jgi:hypothetical protein
LQQPHVVRLETPPETTTLHRTRPMIWRILAPSGEIEPYRTSWSRVNCLTRYIEDDERIITCEDAAELQLQQPHVVRLAETTTLHRTRPMIWRILAPSGEIEPYRTSWSRVSLSNCLTRYIEDDERIITCEDAAELQLQQPHVVRLET